MYVCMKERFSYSLFNRWPTGFAPYSFKLDAEGQCSGVLVGTLSLREVAWRIMELSK